MLIMAFLELSNESGGIVKLASAKAADAIIQLLRIFKNCFNFAIKPRHL